MPQNDITELGKKTRFTGSEENKKSASLGGKRAAETKRRMKNTAAIAKMVLELKPTLSGDMRRALEKMGVNTDDELTIEMISQLAIAQKAMKGDQIALDKLIEYSGKCSSEKQRMEREKLALDKKRYIVEKTNSDAAVAFNAQINSLASLINNPVEDEDINNLSETGSGEVVAKND